MEAGLPTSCVRLQMHIPATPAYFLSGRNANRSEGAHLATLVHARRAPSGPVDQRFTFAYIYGAVEANTDNAFALVMPEVNTDGMQTFLDRFAATIGEDEHVAMILDQAGWHGANEFKVPANITFVPLPPYSPELNPAERVWEYLKENWLSLRLLDDYDAIVEAACRAWNKLTAEAGRLTSLTWLPWAT